jgi:hypothetical protein
MSESERMMEVQSYFESLQSRLDHFEFMNRRRVSFADWQPEPAKCHENVDFWVAHNQTLKAVRGWMVTTSVGSDRCVYEAHSVIEDEGALYDITLRDDVACERIPFLRHLGSEEEFLTMRGEGRAQFLFPPIPFDEWSAAQLPTGSGDDQDSWP